MIRTILVLLGLIMAPASLAAESFPVSTFDGYELKLTPVKSVNGFKQEQFLGSVQQPDTLLFKLHLPFEVQQLRFFVSNGQPVAKSERIAELIGHDVELFVDDLKRKKQLLALASKQYKSHKALYKNGSIDINVWQQISQDYLDKEYAYKKLTHIDEVLEYGENKIFLVAPRDGYFITGEQGEMAFAMSADTYVQIDAPINSFVINDSLSHEQCQFSVQRIENNSNGLDSRVWAKLTSMDCQYDYFALLSMAKVEQANLYSVPAVAVALLNEGESIFVQRGTEIIAVEISTKAIESGQYIFSADDLRPRDQVVLWSVGAVKGVFMALGNN